MRRLFELKCSNCRYQVAVKATSARAAGVEFERTGWKVERTSVRCPSCIKRDAERVPFGAATPIP